MTPETVRPEHSEGSDLNQTLRCDQGERMLSGCPAPGFELDAGEMDDVGGEHWGSY
ncbi:MAG: hypothetical protein H7203_13470 [Rhizobacter sp.]|nr:hypothetical protein [Burkholderiales bacterium]